MTPRELNRDVARLVRAAQAEKGFENEEKIKAEICRLYYADDRFDYMNKKSILTLLRLNLRYRAVPLHVFGVRLDLEKLV